MKNSRAGRRAPVTLRELGTVLSLLDRVSSCFWGCRGGDHVIEYLVGRAASSGRAALRLLRFGLYDEALATVRHVGEIANLLFLFTIDPRGLDEWRTATPRDRWVSFRPAAVRQRLEKAGEQVPITSERYGLLSEGAIHPSARPPQSHNPLGISVTATYQRVGALLVLNELALATAFVALAAALSPGTLEADRKRQLLSAGRSLAEGIGGVTVTDVERLYEDLRRQPGFAEVERSMRRVQAARSKRVRAAAQDNDAVTRSKPKLGWPRKVINAIRGRSGPE
jgi:hypothetical protein